MSKRYVIDLPDDAQYILINGASENHCYTRVEQVDDLEELNSDYINENFGELQDEAYKQGYAEAERIWRAPSSDNEFYQKGLGDAWEAAKKIFGYEIDGAIPIADIGNVFGYEPCKAFCTADILRDFTVQEAIAKLKAYEDKQKDRIEVGDIVDVYGKIGVVTYAYKNTFNVMMYDGSTGRWRREDLKKTGKHYDIASILEAMRK